METKKYLKILAANDEYKTDPKTVLSSLPSSIKFYSTIVWVIYQANRLAISNKYDSIPWVNSSLLLLDGFEKAGMKFHISGMNNIRNFDGPAVFIGNHMSTMETLILPSMIHPIKKVCFVVKKELTTYPLFGPVNNMRHPIIVGRSNPRDDLKIVLNEGAERLKSGRSVIIFPQRTRKFQFDVNSFNTLGIKLAKQNNVPIVPIAILTDSWQNGKIVKEFGKIDTSKEVKICVGEHRPIVGNGNDEHKYVLEFIKSKLTEWGRKEFILE